MISVLEYISKVKFYNIIMLFFSCFTRNTLFLPVYDAEYIASKIMDAIQKEKFYLIMPLTLRLLAFKT